MLSIDPREILRALNEGDINAAIETITIERGREEEAFDVGGPFLRTRYSGLSCVLVTTIRTEGRPKEMRFGRQVASIESPSAEVRHVLEGLAARDVRACGARFVRHKSVRNPAFVMAWAWEIDRSRFVEKVDAWGNPAEIDIEVDDIEFREDVASVVERSPETLEVRLRDGSMTTVKHARSCV